MRNWLQIFLLQHSLMRCRYHIFVRPQFMCQTPKIPKILTFFHGAAETFGLMWRNLFGYCSTQNAISGQIDQNTVGQPWVDHKSKLVKIIPKQHYVSTSNPTYLVILVKFDTRLTFESSKNPNFDMAIKTDLDQCRCEDCWILFPTIIHGLKSELK